MASSIFTIANDFFHPLYQFEVYSWIFFILWVSLEPSIWILFWMLSCHALLCLTATSSRVSNGCKRPTNLKGSDSLQHGLWEVFVTCHMRRSFANSTSSRWNAFRSEVISFWPSTFSIGWLGAMGPTVWPTQNVSFEACNFLLRRQDCRKNRFRCVRRLLQQVLINYFQHAVCVRNNGRTGALAIFLRGHCKSNIGAYNCPIKLKSFSYLIPIHKWKFQKKITINWMGIASFSTKK